jgi:hypothetical protein
MGASLRDRSYRGPNGANRDTLHTESAYRLTLHADSWKADRLSNHSGDSAITEHSHTTGCSSGAAEHASPWTDPNHANTVSLFDRHVRDAGRTRRISNYGVPKAISHLQPS